MLFGSEKEDERYGERSIDLHTILYIYLQGVYCDLIGLKVLLHLTHLPLTEINH